MIPTTPHPSAAEDIAKLEKMWGRSMTQSETEMMGELGHATELAAKQTRAWLRSTITLTETIAADDAGTSDIEMWWIRLVGTLNELRPYFASARTSKFSDGRSVADILPDIEQADPMIAQIIVVKLAISDLLDAALALFTDEERVLMEYMRHEQSHPNQHMLRRNVQPGANVAAEPLTIRDSHYEPKLTKQRGKWHTDAIKTAINTVLAAHTPANQQAVAEAFAQRLRQHMAQIGQYLGRLELLATIPA